MIKRINIFSLKEGADPDKVWKYWLEVHAAHVKKIPGLRKYVINRVIKQLPGPAGKKGVKYWGIVELWFDSEADHDRAINSPAYNQKDEWTTFVGPPSITFVEEKVLVE